MTTPTNPGAQNAGNAWQGIETLPDEGTIAVLYCPREVYHDLCGPVRNAAFAYEIAVFLNGKWMEPDTGHTDYGEDWRPAPTHWQPLPTPPQEPHP